MKPESTKDVPLTAAELQYGKPQDRIVKLLQMGFSTDDVFVDIYESCRMSINTKRDKQALADIIAQIDRIDVFAKGTIPEGV